MLILGGQWCVSVGAVCVRLCGTLQWDPLPVCAYLAGWRGGRKRVVEKGDLK